MNKTREDSVLTCDKCGGLINEESKFCPHCGDPVTEADTPVTAVVSSNVAQVELSFGKSTSASYEQAVKIASNIPSYETSGEGKALLHTVVLPMTEVELIINLWELVGSWKSSRMLINGQPVTKKTLVYKCVGCFRERLKSYNKEQYCYGEHHYDLNIWGCKQLQMPLNHWGGGWLEYGSMTKSGVWVFDKKRIKHELEHQLHENSLCPVLDPAKVLQTLDSLPDRIDPKKDADWEYDTRYEKVKGAYKDVAVGVKPVVKRVTRYVLGDYRPTWDFEDEVEEYSSASAGAEYEVKLVDSGGGEPRVHKKKSGKKWSGYRKFGCAILAIFVIIVVLAIIGGDSS
jgi:hypothetical protein